MKRRECICIFGGVAEGFWRRRRTIIAAMEEAEEAIHHEARHVISNVIGSDQMRIEIYPTPLALIGGGDAAVMPQAPR